MTAGLAVRPSRRALLVVGVLACVCVVLGGGARTAAAQDGIAFEWHPTVNVIDAVERTEAFEHVSPAELGVLLEQVQPDPMPMSGREPRTDVKAAIRDSLKLLFIEHSFRIAFQEKTRRELSGPFWRDYRQSVRVPGQWGDTDAWWVNYIGHPIHGAAAGYNWLDHSPDASREVGASRGYWASRARATAWAAGYSLQFEIGPFSEASIGNVGMRPETTGWVDHVVTPVGAFGLIVAEDALDRFLVKWVEARSGNPVWRAALRIVLNPARTLSNTAGGRFPWHREGRPLGWVPHPDPTAAPR